ncbi:cell wall-associated NlpC family hydrolase [Paenibacillus shirakamiensis]|uniref:Cell wall-associated NlpC family hydrolase n=1 Tax=Paenibacillus shirakamiensis TaxID=1265935 RepID=A0ABS4JM32_9BACL|nr:C40 family peptidase [Paenibacillus shirakamiensis]MBP2002767.1 cell wall-associated NlpC family hydrolase [Paenibacillus shirakamiensis]
MKKKLTAVAVTMSILFTLGAGSAFADSKLDKVVDRVIGTDYKSGGTSTNGFDCSGFTQYVFAKLGIDLPHQSGSQFRMGSSVSKGDLKAGDLVFFNTLGSGVSHVGVFVGDGKFAHASSSKGVTISKLSDSYYTNRYVGAKRILSNEAFQSVADSSDDVE